MPPRDKVILSNGTAAANIIRPCPHERIDTNEHPPRVRVSHMKTAHEKTNDIVKRYRIAAQRHEQRRPISTCPPSCVLEMYWPVSSVDGSSPALRYQVHHPANAASRNGTAEKGVGTSEYLDPLNRLRHHRAISGWSDRQPVKQHIALRIPKSADRKG